MGITIFYLDRFFSVWHDIILPFIEARSFYGRAHLYIVTFNAWKERWLFGWGTQRDLLGAEFVPAGSHSDYLGFLFKQGVLGFLFMVLFFAKVFEVAVRNYQHGVKCKSAEYRNLTISLLAALVYIAIHKFTEVVSLDAITFHLVWTVYGLVFILRKKYKMFCEGSFAPRSELLQGDEIFGR